jgi:hypothetical protein
MMDEEKRKARLDLLKNRIKNEDQFILWQMSLLSLDGAPLSPDFKYEEISELIVALENKDKNYYFKGNTLCRKKNTKDKKDKALSKAQQVKQNSQKMIDILNDPLHEATAKLNVIMHAEPIEVNTIQRVKEPVKKICKLCKNNFKQKKLEAYQVVTIDDYYSLEENTHYVCQNCIEEYRIEVKSK